MVAGAVLVTWPRGRLPALVAAAKRQRAWGPVALNALYSFSPGIDWLAHLGGGLTGGLLLWSGWLAANLTATARPTNQSPPRDKQGTRAFAALSGAGLFLSIVAAWVTGRPWDLRRTPKLSRIDVAEAAISIDLPPLVGPTTHDKTPSDVLSFGGLQYDPVAFVVVLPPATFSPAELADLDKALEAVKKEIEKGQGTLEGFRVTAPLELEHREGAPYLKGRQEAPDGRSADMYYVVTGWHLSGVMVVATKASPEAWKEAAARVPFSVVRRD
jgi:hypothetical protein